MAFLCLICDNTTSYVIVCALGDSPVTSYSGVKDLLWRLCTSSTQCPPPKHDIISDPASMTIIPLTAKICTACEHAFAVQTSKTFSSRQRPALTIPRWGNGSHAWTAGTLTTSTPPARGALCAPSRGITTHSVSIPPESATSYQCLWSCVVRLHAYK